jgi:hypothetical protein
LHLLGYGVFVTEQEPIMSKPASGMHGGKQTQMNTRPGKMNDLGPSPTHPNTSQEARTETSRPVSAGAGRHRGDRRDMSKHYTGNEKHSARGNTPRKDVSTRAR